MVRDAVTKSLSEDLIASDKVTGSKVQIHDIQGIKAGQNYLMSVELAVPGNWSVKETRIVEDAVRDRVGARVKGVRRVRIRFVAKEADAPDFADEFVGTRINLRGSPDPEVREHSHNDAHTWIPSETSNGKVRQRH